MAFKNARNFLSGEVGWNSQRFPVGFLFLLLFGHAQGLRVAGSNPYPIMGPFLKKLFGVALTSGHMMPHEWRMWISTSGKKRRLKRTQPLDDKRLKWNRWLSSCFKCVQIWNRDRYASQVHTMYTRLLFTLGFKSLKDVSYFWVRLEPSNLSRLHNAHIIPSWCIKCESELILFIRVGKTMSPFTPVW